MLKGGIPVEIMDSKFFSGKIKIRPRGSTVELWTVSEAITTPAAPSNKIQGVPVEGSSAPGYNDGFIVGEARHNDKIPSLDAGRLQLMASHQTKSYIAEGAGRSAPELQRAFLRGYQDGLAGKARGGGTQPALPTLPIKISEAPKLVTKKLGTIGRNDLTSLQVLATLVAKNPEKNVFVVVARFRYNENTSEYVKYLYDRSNRIFLKLARTEVKNLEDSFMWTLSLDTPVEALTEDGLWGLDSTLRQIRSKHGEAKNTIPLRYEQSGEITKWP